ncbi:DUF91 domain-containing protein [Candidatus Bathyarchaeota archaeon]|nr:DUF91 domain-containing protein [Candidatus Bathyarchaeota archaeon]
MKLDRIELYLDADSSHSARAQRLVSLLKELRKKWMIEYAVISTGQLSNEDIERIGIEIRSIPPQVRGRIVSSRHNVLPLSRTKRLNLSNTPIILMRKKSLPVDVYPHLLGTKYFSPEDSLEKILRVGPADFLEARGMLEEPLLKIIADHPDSLEEGMTFLDANLKTDVGVVDAVMKDRLGNLVVVEAETSAKDSSVAQVCRLSAGYAKSINIPPDKIRKIIVCVSYEGQLAATCEGSNVELYRLEFRRVI